MGFQELGLNENIVRALQEAGYESPTPVQQRAVPAALAGRDLVVSSQTGSGKTAGFMLPSLHRLNDGLSDDPLARIKFTGPGVLVLTPTRELALQVTDACRKYGSHLRRARAVSVVGGMPYPVQNKQLSQPYDVLVATPGRLIDHMARGRIDFSSLQMLVLDEADRMLDMGFIDDIEHILAALPATRQTLLFSATIDHRIQSICNRLMKDAERIEIVSEVKGHANIEQRMLYTDDLGHKNRLLDHILRDASLEQAIVFTATKRDAETVAISLDEAGFAAAALHGDMSQSQRNRTLTGLRRGRYRVLVATDVAARGIDVQTISHVINFDLPKNPEDYVHRIGRTGRAGRSGVAISFASGRERFQVKAIERFTHNTIAVHTIPGFEPKVEVPRDNKRPSPGGKRFGGPREGFGARREHTNFNRDRGHFAQPDVEQRGGFGQRNRAQAGAAPGNAFPDAKRSGGREFNRDFNRDGNRSAPREFNRDGNRDFNRDGNRDGNRSAPREFNRDGNRDFNRDGNRDGNRSAPREFNRDGNRDFNRDFNRDGNRDGNRSAPREFNRDAKVDGNRDWNRDRPERSRPAQHGQRDGNRDFADRNRASVSAGAADRPPRTFSAPRRKFDR